MTVRTRFPGAATSACDQQQATALNSTAAADLGLIYTFNIFKLGFAVKLGLHVWVMQDSLPQTPFIKQGANARYDQEGNR